MHRPATVFGEHPADIHGESEKPAPSQEESDQIVAAFRRRGISVRYMVGENEGHGFPKEENRFDFYRAVEKFLAEHPGSRKELQ